MSTAASDAPFDDPKVVTVPIEVRYAETDQMGVVHHSRYLVWFEVARTRLCSRTGFHYAEIEQMGFFLVVSRCELAFRRGARYGETVEITCRMARHGARGLRFEYEVRRAGEGEGGERLVTGATEHIWVDRASGRPCRVPDAVREGFERLAP